MKKTYVSSLFLVLALCGSDAFAQGYRSASNIPETELKQIFVSVVKKEKLNADQTISYDLVSTSFQRLTQNIYLDYQKYSEGSLVDFKELWSKSDSWLSKSEFNNHPYYLALYCLYLNDASVKKMKGYKNGGAVQSFIQSTMDYIGSKALYEKLKDDMVGLEKLLSNEWDVLELESQR